MSEQDATAERWLAEERAARANLSEQGTSSHEVIGRYDGLGFLRAMLRGEIGYLPIADTLDFTVVAIERGKSVVQGSPAFAHYNPIGSVHGGWYCTLLDTALGCAVHSTLPRGKGYTTLELKVNMIRPLTERTGPVRALGEIIHSGNQTAIAEARLVDAAGKIYGFATTTCLVFEVPQDR